MQAISFPGAPAREVVIMDSAADSRLSSHQRTRKRLFRVTIKFAFLIHIKIYGLGLFLSLAGRCRRIMWNIFRTSINWTSLIARFHVARGVRSNGTFFRISSFKSHRRSEREITALRPSSSLFRSHHENRRFRISNFSARWKTIFSLDFN